MGIINHLNVIFILGLMNGMAGKRMYENKYKKSLRMVWTLYGTRDTLIIEIVIITIIYIVKLIRRYLLWHM